MQALEVVREAEAELVSSEERNRATVEAAVDAIITINERAIIQSLNPAAIHLFGYSREELIGRNVSMLVPAPHREQHDSYVQRYCSTGKAKIIGLGRDVEGLRKDGTTFPMHLSIGEFQAAGERYFVGILHDLSERKSAEESARRLSAIVEFSDDAIIGKSLTGTILSWNRGAERLFGFRKEEILGENISVLVPESHICELAEIVRRIRNSESIGQLETVRRRRDGSMVAVSLNISPIFDEDGEVIEASMIARDITASIDAHRRLEETNLELQAQRDETEAQRQELEEMNSQLLKTRDAAQEAANAKSEFLRNMSHEIRTPMTAILGNIDLLEEETIDSISDEIRRAHLDPIRRNGLHLLQIVNDILDLSKFEAGKLVVERLAVSPVSVVNEVAEMMQARAEIKNLTLTVEFSSPIPERIESDPTRLRQVLINLVGNAIKFTEHGGVRLSTSFVRTSQGAFIDFNIIDTGIGMAQDHAEMLFQPFTQADASMTRKFGGTGLGLSISKRLAGLLGGNVSVVETAIGEGTWIRFRTAAVTKENVNIVDDPGSSLLTTSTATTAISDRPDLSDLRILVVDDGPDNCRLISVVLEKAGAHVAVEVNGKLAVESAQAAQDEGCAFDVILMDMQMPVMDGYEAVRTLRDEGYSGVIVALTAHVMEGEIQRCLDSGCDAYLSKPIKREEFLVAVRDHAAMRAHTHTGISGVS